MILGLGCHVGPWAAQALQLGAAFPSLHPCWIAGQLAMFSREVRSLDIYILIFFLPKNSGNENSTAMCWNQPSVSAGFISRLELGV